MSNYEAVKQAAKNGANLTDIFTREQIEDAFARASVIYNMAEVYTSTAPDWVFQLKKARMQLREGGGESA